MEKKCLVLVVVGVMGLSFLGLTTVFAKGEGTTGAVVLSQPIGARAVGMAEAYTAVEADVCGLHYNPAGLAGLKSRQASVLGQTGIAEDIFGIAAFGMPIEKIGTVAGSLIYYTAGDIDLIDSTGAERTVNAETDILATLSCGRSLGDLLGDIPLAVGLNVKILSSSLVEETATAFAVDVGGLYKLLDEKLALGLALQNAGTKLQYLDGGEKWALPMVIRGGAAYKQPLAEGHEILGAVDMVIPLDSKIKANLGLEYLFQELLAVRAGYKIGYDSDSATIGLGFLPGELIGQKIGIDYALSLMKDLPLTHRVGLSYSF